MIASAQRSLGECLPYREEPHTSQVELFNKHESTETDWVPTVQSSSGKPSSGAPYGRLRADSASALYGGRTSSPLARACLELGLGVGLRVGLGLGFGLEFGLVVGARLLRVRARGRTTGRARIRVRVRVRVGSWRAPARAACAGAWRTANPNPNPNPKPLALTIHLPARAACAGAWRTAAGTRS